MSFDIQITVINQATRQRVLDQTHWAFDEYGVGQVLRTVGDEIQSGEITLGRSDRDAETYDASRGIDQHVTRIDAKGRVLP